MAAKNNYNSSGHLLITAMKHSCDYALNSTSVVSPATRKAEWGLRSDVILFPWNCSSRKGMPAVYLESAQAMKSFRVTKSS